MVSCVNLNVLDNQQGFLLVATLIVIVLLVRAQLYARGEARKQDKDVNGVMGFVWIYLAILFALAAVAALFFNVTACAKGFLILSFLMTVVSILAALLKRGSLIFIPRWKSLVGESTERKWWVLVWLALLIGLGFISFHLAGCLGCCFLGAGEALVLSVFVVVTIFIICAIRASKKN